VFTHELSTNLFLPDNKVGTCSTVKPDSNQSFLFGRLFKGRSQQGARRDVSTVRLVHLGRSTCHAISGRGGKSIRNSDGSVNFI